LLIRREIEYIMKSSVSEERERKGEKEDDNTRTTTAHAEKQKTACRQSHRGNFPCLINCLPRKSRHDSS